LGVAVGYGLYDIAVVLSFVTYVALRFLTPLKQVAKATGGQDVT
jgi:putative Mg2+ transporter-C (MgtC) family protein